MRQGAEGYLGGYLVCAVLYVRCTTTSAKPAGSCSTGVQALVCGGRVLPLKARLVPLGPVSGEAGGTEAAAPPAQPGSGVS